MSEIIVEATGLPLRFPDAHAEARARAEEFRRLTPQGRFREIAALLAVGLAMVRSSPRRAAIEERWAAQEAEWQRIQTKVFASHVQ